MCGARGVEGGTVIAERIGPVVAPLTFRTAALTFPASKRSIRKSAAASKREHEFFLKSLDFAVEDQVIIYV